MILSSDDTHTSQEGGAGSSLDIFVSSVGNDDAVDNPANHFSSDVAKQHARFIESISSEGGSSI